MSLVRFLSGHCSPAEYSSLVQLYLQQIIQLRGEQTSLRDLMGLLNSRLSLSGTFYKQVMQEFLRWLRALKDTLSDKLVHLGRLATHLNEKRVPVALLVNYLLACE